VSGYSWTISPTKVNNLHYGFIRQGVGDNGSSQEQFVLLRGLSTPVSNTRSTNVVVPIHNLTDDFSWTRGKHTLQFGGNWRFINNSRTSNAQSFSDAITNVGFLPTTGFAGKGTSLDPGCASLNPVPQGCTWNFPAVDAGSRNAYDFPMAALAGIITESDATYQRDKNGNSLASPSSPGAFIKRRFRANEFETYLQEHIFGPLRMTDTGFDVPEEKRSRLAKLYETGPNGFLREVKTPPYGTYAEKGRGFASGGGGLFSTAGDYLRFGQMLLNHGNLEGKQILGRKTVELMTANNITFLRNGTLPGNPSEGFGLGGSVRLDVPKGNSLGSEGQFGWNGAATTTFNMDPEEKTVALLFTQHLPYNQHNIFGTFYTLFYASLVD